jgi:prophage regulatory protein
MSLRLIRLPEVLSRTGVSAMTIWRWEKKGLFPRRLRIGANSVGWPEPEIDSWCQALIARRDAQHRRKQLVDHDPEAVTAQSIEDS